MAQTVKQFVTDAYQLISANSPTTPLKGDDFSKGLQFLNELLSSYSGTGLMITVSKEVTTPIIAGQLQVTFGASGYDVNEGRLANIENAWLILNGVVYPLVPSSDHLFNSQYRYNPLLGLPIYAIIFDEINSTTLRLYPGASQGYQLYVYGKFELPEFTSMSVMDNLPGYYTKFLRLALAQELAYYKGRSSAWDDKLDRKLLVAQKEVEATSNMNLNVINTVGNMLNGSARCRSGI